MINKGFQGALLVLSQGAVNLDGWVGDGAGNFLGFGGALGPWGRLQRLNPYSIN